MVGKRHLAFELHGDDLRKTFDFPKPLAGGQLDCGFDTLFGLTKGSEQAALLLHPRPADDRRTKKCNAVHEARPQGQRKDSRRLTPEQTSRRDSFQKNATRDFVMT
jgi:hypothetical protein